MKITVIITDKCIHLHIRWDISFYRYQLHSTIHTLWHNYVTTLWINQQGAFILSQSGSPAHCPGVKRGSPPLHQRRCTHIHIHTYSHTLQGGGQSSDFVPSFVRCWNPSAHLVFVKNFENCSIIFRKKNFWHFSTPHPWCRSKLHLRGQNFAGKLHLRELQS